MNKNIPIAELENVNIEIVNKKDLVDVSGFTFDYTIPHEQRAEWLLKKVNNPYCFRVGELAVKLSFTDNAPVLQDIFTGFLIRKKSGL